MSVVGKEAPSTCESLNPNQKVKEWIESFQMPGIDEECESVISATNEDMLNYVHGHTKTVAQIADSGVEDSEIDSGLSLSKQNTYVSHEVPEVMHHTHGFQGQSVTSPSTDDSYPFLATGRNDNGRQPLLYSTDTGSINSGNYVDRYVTSKYNINALPIHATNESTLTTAVSGSYVDHNNTTSNSRPLSHSNTTADAEDGGYVDRYVTSKHDVNPLPLHSTNKGTLTTPVDVSYIDHNTISEEPLSHCNSSRAADEGSHVERSYVASNSGNDNPVPLPHCTTAVDGSYIDYDATPNSQPLSHSNTSTTAEKRSYIDRFVSSNNDNNTLPLNSANESSLTTADEGSYIDHYIASNNDNRNPLHSTTNSSSATTTAVNGSYIDHDATSNSKLSQSINTAVHAPFSNSGYTTESDV